MRFLVSQQRMAAAVMGLARDALSTGVLGSKGRREKGSANP
jgi:hypothetical protein